MFKKLLLISTTALALSTPVAQAQDVLATINGQPIERSTVEEAAKNIYTQRVLDQYILTEALKQHVEDSEELQTAVSEQMTKLREEFDDEDEYKAYLLANGYGSPEDYEASIYQNILLESYLLSQATVTDEEIQAYLDNDYKPYVELAQIVVGSEEEATELIQRLINGEDFGELAKEVSLDEATKDQNGYMGRIALDKVERDILDVIQDVENYQLAPDFLVTDQGVHLIYVLHNGTPHTLETDRELLESVVKRQKIEDKTFQQEALKELLDSVDLVIEDPLLKRVETLIEEANQETTEETEAEGNSEK